MAHRLTNSSRSKGMRIKSDANGDYLELPNGKLWYFLDTAITANTTVTTAVAGSLASTTHATGLASMFRSDGSKWQFLTNA